LRRREFEFVFGLCRGVVAVALAEPADGVDGEFLLALQADAGAGGEPENVLGFEFAPGTGILGARRAALPEGKSGHRAQRNGVKPPGLKYPSRSFTHHCIPILTPTASVSRPTGQRDSL
jgi:hypothetical protein